MKSQNESWINGALYPDREPPSALTNLAEQVDFLERLCAAWDFGILPDASVVMEIRQARWRDPIDACHFLTSPTYHLLRRWHGLARLPYLGQQMAYIRDDPNLAHI